MDFQAIFNAKPDIGHPYNQPTTTHASRANVGSCSIWGFTDRVHFVYDFFGMLCMSFIVLYWVYGVSSIVSIIIWPRYVEGHISFGVIVVYAFLCIMTLVSLFRASWTNPGRIPLVDQLGPEEETNWTYCKVCRTRRPLRSHHCRRCGQCVLKMDHHCPWINNCVGEANLWLFLLLLMYAAAMSTVSTLLCILHWYVYPACVTCDRETFFLKYEYGFMVLSTVLASVMAFGMTCMLLGQHMNQLWDRTTIDSMREPFPKVMPKQTRPCMNIYSDVCGPGPKLFWIFPCRRGRLPLVYVYPNFPDIV